MHTGDVPVRVSSNAWNSGAAWQGVADWQARGSTGTATKVTTDPRGGPGTDSEKSIPFRRLTSGNTWRPPVLQGPLLYAMTTNHTPAAVGLPGLGACRHKAYSRYRGVGTSVIRGMSGFAVQEAHGISAN